MTQRPLFCDAIQLQTKVIARRPDFESLFEGFTALRAVSYVVSPALLLDFMDQRGYERVEVLVGEKLAAGEYREQLADAGRDVLDRLAQRMEKGDLVIHVPDRIVHSKFYLLEGPKGVRVIVTSANLTETARRASRQTNYAWTVDCDRGDPLFARMVADYERHLSGSTRFLGDLLELLKQENSLTRAELIEMWLRQSGAEENDADTRKALHELAAHALALSAEGEPVFTLQLPSNPRARRETERFVAPVNPRTSGDALHVDGRAYLRYVQERHGFPLLRVDTERRHLILGIDGVPQRLSEPLPEPPDVARALTGVEAYLDSVEWGEGTDPTATKTGMFEALLYMFFAPFAHEYMKERRARYGSIDARGPRLLYICGDSQNGKSTFFRYAMKLLAGRALEPLSGAQLTKGRVRTATTIGTTFPLVFDDVMLTQKAAVFEEVLKTYWEVWWREEFVSPQIILSSNNATLKEWARSRVKRIDFDVHFSPDGRTKERLAALFAEPNPIFRWFSHLYLQTWAEAGSPDEDELCTARQVFRSLYAHAGRQLPGYFPVEPLEKLYDPGRKAWRDLVRRLGKAKIDWEADRAVVRFSGDMQRFEVAQYASLLPPSVKHGQRGSTIVIESRDVFRRWLENGDGRRSRPWWSRILRRD